MAAPPLADRAFDIVLWGATGYTGRLVAAYLAKKSARIAIAGRNRDKLEALRRDLAAETPSASQLPILLGDAKDSASLEAIAAQTRVVCATAGPFAQVGSGVVAACVKNGTSYCDITGEVQWIRKMIDAHHDDAQHKRARIVPCCGFDSIPSDLGVWMVQEHARKHLGRALSDIQLVVMDMRGGFSGGTAASLIEVLAEATRDRDIRRLLGNPHGLDPSPPSERRPEDRDQRGVRWDADVARWTGPFVMAGINTRIVRRTNALLGYAYGQPFTYGESTSFGVGPGGFARAALFTGGLGAFIGAATVPSLRELIMRRLPAPGEGPTKEQRDRGRFTIRLTGKLEPGGAPRVVGEVVGRSDPGYGETSKMLGEAALCLAQDERRLPERFGLLTPASAMGDRLLERLRTAGMTFETRDV
ncbi:MAG: saccharopine dehydrogenase [Polyangiaceae bacterium]|nr:saccharopine dehydrogenase [Polyangiaceae bacterium]